MPESRFRRACRNLLLGGLGTVGGICLLLGLITVLKPGLWAFAVLAFAPPEELMSVPSPSTRHRIDVLYDAPLLYSPHGITIRLLEKSDLWWRELVSYRTRLRNDGGNLGAQNVQVQWREDGLAYICLRGEEQDPEGLRITVSSNQSRSEIFPHEEACSKIAPSP